MVIEVTKEVDFVRIGIDRYSLKTGLKIKSIMVLNTRVLKEPRGFVRVIQCILAIVAFSTTAGFSTSCSFEYNCGSADHEISIKYTFGYPFEIRDNVIVVPPCENGENGDVTTTVMDEKIIRLPFDFSSSAEFFVATGVLSSLYAVIALVVYLFLHERYSSDPKIPVIDLGLTAIISVFWLAGSSAWARAVQDLKYYLHPESLFGIIPVCMNDKCKVEEDGHYAALNVSLILGFACFVVWLASLWFVFKETVFHTPAEVVSDMSQNQNAKGDGRV